MVRNLLIVLFCLSGVSSIAQKTIATDVLVIGGGTSGTAAGIQSARAGAATLIVESTTWLGGMISAAGVSAIDGNHNLPSGFWAEFRNALYAVYGGPEALNTGWVSNTLFEPHVADSIFKSMAAKEKALTIFYSHQFLGLQKKGNRILTAQFRNKKTGERVSVKPKLVVDATELGDAMKAAGVPYDLGMEADAISNEKVGVTKTNNIVQDITYVAILKDYGEGANRTIARPANYDPAEFDGSSTDYYVDKNRKAPSVDGKKMLDYGRLPRGKYMINWPIYGNDTYLNLVEMTEEEREKELVKAKQTTLRFVYFIQQQLGFKHLGLADDEFPTADSLALMPYHREGRRVKGLVRFAMRHISEPFTYGDPLYRTGIAVGDYPIDHHHKKNADAPQHLEFYPIPSYTIPLGALIPQGFDNLIVAEKGISVTNVANGATRLQPVVLLIGQAAGLLAALSSANGIQPKDVPVRTVQQKLLENKAYLLPYIDIQPNHPHFEAVQKIGACGLLKGTGVPFKWANQTWFYPDSTVAADSFLKDFSLFQPIKFSAEKRWLSIQNALTMIGKAWSATRRAAGKNKMPAKHNINSYAQKNWTTWMLKNFDPLRPITRVELAVLLHNTIDPFGAKGVSHKGAFLQKNKQ